MSAFPSILFRADDAGGARAANLAIAEAVTRGPVRNVSVMACGPELAHAASVFGPLAAAGRIALGLHATINAEWAEVKWGPVAPADEVGSLLRGDGAFMSSPLVLHERGFVVAEVLHEVAAQLGCLRAVGLAPVYLDTHMGFDWLPGVREGLAALAPDARRHFSVSERGRILLVPVDEVVFLKAELKYVTAFCATRSYLLDESLVQLEQEFPERFLRIHRNCLVARAAIAGVERAVGDDGDAHWEVLLKGCDERLPVSRRQWPAIKAALGL